MKHSLAILISQLLILPMSWAFDEKDIPPPPMPEYMKDSGYKPAEASRSTASEVGESFNDQPIESIKQEFLQAGQEDLETEELSAVDEPTTGEIDEGSAEPLVQNTNMVLEDPVEPAVVETVNEVEESVPEFQEAGIDDPAKGEVEKNYLQSGTQELEEEVQEYEPNEDRAGKDLAGVEVDLEKSEQEAELTLAKKGRKVSSKGSFKSGMYKFSKECQMYSKASVLSGNEGVIRSGRKLWIDAHNPDWHKAYKKEGTVFIPADCLTQ